MMATNPARVPGFFGSEFSFCCFMVAGTPLIRCGDAQRFHLTVEVTALEAQRGGSLGHVPAIFLQLAQNKFTLIGTARFVQRGVWLLGTLRHTAKDLGRQMVRLDARLRTNNNQALHQIAKLAYVSRPRMPQQKLHRRVSQLTRLLSIGGAEIAPEAFGTI